MTDHGGPGLTRRGLLRAVGAAGACSTGVTGLSLARDTSPSEAWARSGIDSPRGLRASEEFLVARYSTAIRGFEQATGDRSWGYDVGTRQYETEIHDGTLYVTTLGTARALASDGTEQWRYDHDGSGAIEVAFDGSRGFVGDADGLSAVSLGDGTAAWTTTGGPTRPIAAGDGVVVAAQRSDQGDRIAGYDAASGTESWQYAPDGGGRIELLEDDDAAIYLRSGDTVAAVTYADGTERWSVDVDSRRALDVARVGDLAVIGVDGVLSAKDRTSGADQWLSNLGSAAIPFDVGGNGVAYLSEEPRVYVVRADGTIAYGVDAGSTGGQFSQPGVLEGDTLYLANDGTVRSYDGAGSRQWAWSLGNGSANSLGIGGDGLYALDGETLYGFDLDGGGIDGGSSQTPVPSTTQSATATQKTTGGDATGAEGTRRTDGGSGPGFGLGAAVTGVVGFGLYGLSKVSGIRSREPE